jgi:hypothetical protein
MSEAGQRRLHVEALSEIGSLSEVTIGIIEFMGIVTGPIRRGDGIAPAVALVDPKFPHNVGAAADQFFDAFEEAVPVAVELRRNAESLIDFVHPDHALYVFGPEDGSPGRATLAQCHRFLAIPTRHCVNLSAAVYTVR